MLLSPIPGECIYMKKNNKRLRFLSEEDIQKLLPECPEHLRNIVECALNTGIRRAEILTLKWNQIRNGLIYLEKTKNGDARQVPINDDLSVIFRRIKRDQGVFLHEVKKGEKIESRYVFTYQAGKETPAKSIKRVDRSFKAALTRTGIEDFKFHDLRHTFASHFIMRGGTIKDLQEILGHRDIKMTMRYSHLSQEHKKKAVNLLNGLTASKNDCHKLSQIENLS